MKRRTFIKALGALTAALGIPVSVAKTEEKYDHWNQPLKGADRRSWLPRSGIFSYLHKGPEGKLKRTK
jgi:hypothetical protein